jgi:hypothetical protein
MNIRYFFVKDRVASKELKVEYCPTGEMVADYFTKPLQGQLFRRLRDIILNIDPSSQYSSGHRSVLSSDVNATKAVKSARENAKNEIANPAEVTIVDRKKLVVDEMN